MDLSAHNEHLSLQTKEIKEKTIPWEGYQRASLITEQELEMLRLYDRGSDLESDQYVLLFVHLLGKLTRVDTLQNILVLLDDYLSDASMERLTKFSELSNSGFLKLLQKEDEYIQLKSAKILAFIVNHDIPTHFDPTEYFAWVLSKFESDNPNVVDLAVQYLASVLSSELFRQVFLQDDARMFALVKLLEQSKLAQMQYQLVYCIWLLSFVPSGCAKFALKYHVVNILKELAKSAIKEKVVRVIMATFKNMVIKAPEENIVAMIGSKLVPVIEMLAIRKWSDADITDDLQFLCAELNKHLQSLSTFEEYASEVIAGKLEWSPSHLSEQFWKLNANKLCDNHAHLIVKLCDIIKNSNEAIDLAVASHDLGQFVKYCGNGRRVLEETGAKGLVMQLIVHENNDVRYQALAAVQ